LVELKILHALADGEKGGCELMEVLGSPRGSVYVWLQRAEAKGLVETAGTAKARGRGGNRRVLWRATPTGRKALAELVCALSG
jgi:DNA-binding PadR family transcriptional regulator